LTAGETLDECVRSLAEQIPRNFELIIVDNSGRGLVRGSDAGRLADHVIENETNVGFGAAINQGFRMSRAPFLATLNDDAVAHPGWLAALLAAAAADAAVGMCASQVRLAGAGKLDSAGMLIGADGTSKQRGQGAPAAEFSAREDVLFPSGSAALFRRKMLDEIGGFDEEFFLYCEDTDLGLRGRRAGWRCVYVPDAVVEHHYSRSAGRASPLKAYYVERNRLFVIAKNFPPGMLPRAPLVTVARYFWHVISILGGRGAAAEFQREGNSPLRLVWFVIRAHLALLGAAPRLWKQRHAIRRGAALSNAEFRDLLRAHSIGIREVATR